MLAAWVVGGAVALCGALALAEVAALYPRAGGIYVYLREAYGPLTAFLFGWVYLVIIPTGAGAIALVFAEYLGRLMPLTPGQIRGVATALIVVLRRRSIARCVSARRFRTSRRSPRSPPFSR